MPPQITDRLAQTGVGLDLLFFQLAAHPVVQVLHDRLTVGPVMQQPLLIRQPQAPALALGPVDLPDLFQDQAHLLREVLGRRDELPPAVAQAVGQEGVEVAAGVARKRIAHPDGRGQGGGPMLQHSGQVLPRRDAGQS